MTISLRKKKIKRRNFIAKELLTSGLYRQRIVKSVKIYNRKKLKPIKNEEF